MKLLALRGERTHAHEVTAIRAAIPWAPARVLELMSTYALADTTFTLSETDDESGVGVAMRWLNPLHIVDEALNAYPGIAASRHRYFPIGECLIGTGDPYFVESENADLPVYRIPHTAAREDDLAVEQLERVSPSLMSFLATADSE